MITLTVKQLPKSILTNLQCNFVQKMVTLITSQSRLADLPIDTSYVILMSHFKLPIQFPSNYSLTTACFIPKKVLLAQYSTPSPINKFDR